MNFKEQKTNIEILIKNSFSSDLPDNLCLIYIDTDKVIKLFEDISNGLYNTIYGIDQVTGLITTVNRKDQNTPNYIYNDGVEPVQYFGYKNNKRYRELSIPHFNFYIAFVYNTIIVKDVLFKNIYSENNDGKKDYSNSPILVKNFKEELVFTSTVNYKDEIVEEVESMMLEDTEFIGEAERTRMFNNAVLKDIKAEGISLHYLETDIESYFENIYTHSLNELKTLSPYKNIKDKGVEKYFEFLDYFNMKTNLNHTKGILTGPLSSAISAELLLISIDEFIHEKIKDKDISYKRYVDDMWFYSNG